jgi:hypothetical protein
MSTVRRYKSTFNVPATSVVPGSTAVKDVTPAIKTLNHAKGRRFSSRWFANLKGLTVAI